MAENETKTNKEECGMKEERRGRIERTPFMLAGEQKGAAVLVAKAEVKRLSAYGERAFDRLVETTAKLGCQGCVEWSGKVLVRGLDHLLACKTAGVAPWHTDSSRGVRRLHQNRRAA